MVSVQIDSDFNQMEVSSSRELLKVLQGQHRWAMRLSRDPGPVGLSVSPSLERRPPPELRVPATMSADEGPGTANTTLKKPDETLALPDVRPCYKGIRGSEAVRST